MYIYEGLHTVEPSLLLVQGACCIYERWPKTDTEPAVTIGLPLLFDRTDNHRKTTEVLKDPPDGRYPREVAHVYIVHKSQIITAREGKYENTSVRYKYVQHIGEGKWRAPLSREPGKGFAPDT